MDRFGWIRHAQHLGFTLAEGAERVALHRDIVACDDSHQRAAAKVAAIDAVSSFRIDAATPTPYPPI